jgi:hypothetical protein
LVVWKYSRAVIDLSRKNSRPDPWTSLVPDFDTTLTTPPVASPNSAL